MKLTQSTFGKLMHLKFNHTAEQMNMASSGFRKGPIKLNKMCIYALHCHALVNPEHTLAIQKTW